MIKHFLSVFLPLAEFCIPLPQEYKGLSKNHPYSLPNTGEVSGIWGAEPHLLHLGAFCSEDGTLTKMLSKGAQTPLFGIKYLYVPQLYPGAHCPNSLGAHILLDYSGMFSLSVLVQ